MKQVRGANCFLCEIRTHLASPCLEKHNNYSCAPLFDAQQKTSITSMDRATPDIRPTKHPDEKRTGAPRLPNNSKNTTDQTPRRKANWGPETTEQHKKGLKAGKLQEPKQSLRLSQRYFILAQQNSRALPSTTHVKRTARRNNEQKTKTIIKQNDSIASNSRRAKDAADGQNHLRPIDCKTP